jgi:F0F1-type ATP synthase membrane subunit c/vacuolar-type H+-ATPase subunit K
MFPVAGCAVGTGIVYAALLRSAAYSPEVEDQLFNYAALGFAFIETFAFMLIFVTASVLAI